MSVESVIPETMSQSAFADLAGVSRKTVTVWKKKGFVFVENGGAKFDHGSGGIVLLRAA